MSSLHPAAARAYLLAIAEQRIDRQLLLYGGPSDLVQRALLRAHEAQHQYKGTTPEEYRGWIRRILLSVLDKFRRHHRIRPSVPLPEAVAVETPPSGPARQAEQREQLARALDRLPAEQRQIVVLRTDGLEFATIGERVGKSADAARMVYHRALARLRSLLPKP